ncbi:MAG: hypothetical protein WAV20_00375, partial [Blastocatellia bacterium]
GGSGTEGEAHRHSGRRSRGGRVAAFPRAKPIGTEGGGAAGGEWPPSRGRSPSAQRAAEPREESGSRNILAVALPRAKPIGTEGGGAAAKRRHRGSADIVGAQTSWERRHRGGADIVGAQTSWERRHRGSADILGAQTSWERRPLACPAREG